MSVFTVVYQPAGRLLDSLLAAVEKMKILLVQTSFLGDTILSTPVVAGLKSIYPDAEIRMMTTPVGAELVKRDPLLAGVVIFDKRDMDKGLRGFLRMRARLMAFQFDKAYCLHRSYRSAILMRSCGIPETIGFEDAKLSFLYRKTRPRSAQHHDVLRNLSLLSGDSAAERLDPELRLFAPQEHEISDEISGQLQNLKNHIVLAPGSVWATKRWPWNYYRQLAEYLLSRKLAVVLVGSPAERDTTDKVARDLPLINLAGKTTIGEVMYIIQKASLVVCNDSMALHMASAFKVPNVAIFCATSPEFGFGPWRNRAIIVQREDLPCKPCARHGGQRCPTGTHACMEGLAPETVFRAVEKLLSDPFLSDG
jgi:heptosyltransferase-2